ncbi:MAG TPA: sigma-70 family RNA polymerase sigma factor [Candidatus Baltobacteraceae bacterium]|nr:sigma-70 family RNA polymerase sigma factor [Candidatus Baltobacteraceae bacterium]
MIVFESERERTIREYQYLCSRGARKFMRAGVDRRDLEQVAAIGLIKAADRFDANVGTPFEAYAWILVLGELMHYVRDSERVLRAPRRIRELDRRFSAAERELCAVLGREPYEHEMAKHLGVCVDELRELIRYRDEGTPLSVDALRPNEQLSLSYTIDSHLERVAIDSWLESLTRVEREIIREIYEIDTPIGEIARRLGYSRRHITRLHRNALEKMRSHARPMSA